MILWAFYSKENKELKEENAILEKGNAELEKTNQELKEKQEELEATSGKCVLFDMCIICILYIYMIDICRKVCIWGMLQQNQTKWTLVLPRISGIKI